MSDKINVNEVELNGIKYVKKDSIKDSSPADKVDGLELVLIRTYSAGVHFGYMKKKESTLAGIEVKLVNARRVYYWNGAASLSQLAMEGTNKPNECKISMEVTEIDLIAIEIIPITDKACKILKEVKIWKV